MLCQARGVLRYLHERPCRGHFDEGVPFRTFAWANHLLEEFPHLPKPRAIGCQGERPIPPNSGRGDERRHTHAGRERARTYSLPPTWSTGRSELMAECLSSRRPALSAVPRTKINWPKTLMGTIGPARAAESALSTLLPGMATRLTVYLLPLGKRDPFASSGHVERISENGEGRWPTDAALCTGGSGNAQWERGEPEE